jgi:hypothetical protein
VNCTAFDAATGGGVAFLVDNSVAGSLTVSITRSVIAENRAVASLTTGFGGGIALSLKYDPLAALPSFPIQLDVSETTFQLNAVAGSGGGWLANVLRCC